MTRAFTEGLTEAGTEYTEAITEGPMEGATESRREGPGKWEIRGRTTAPSPDKRSVWFSEMFAMLRSIPVQ